MNQLKKKKCPKKKLSAVDTFVAKIESKDEEELTENEKAILLRKKRAAKFGIPFKLADSDLAKLRRERFGVQTAKGKRGKPILSEEDVEKMAKRTKRFGTTQSSSGLNDLEEQKKKEARAKRFASTH